MFDRIETQFVYLVCVIDVDRVDVDLLDRDDSFIKKAQQAYNIIE